MPIWRPYTSHYERNWYPPSIVRAQGSYLYTAEGKALWDGTCAWWVTVHGHCHPFIAEAIARQAYTLDQVLFGDLLHPAAETLAEKISQRTGLPWVFFSDDGSTAVEVGLKLALQYFYNRGEKRLTFLALEGAYHGDTFGAMSVSARGVFTSPFEDLLFRVEWLPFPTPENESVFFARLEEVTERERIAAFIGEPLLQGVAGMRSYAPHYWDVIAQAVRSKGGLVIADEVFTGFGRTGTLFATDQCQEKPDILCLSKGLTAGFMPLGLTLATDEVFSAFYDKDPTRTFYHGHSYTGNPLACAAAVANLTLWEQPETWEQLRHLVQVQADLAREWQGKHPHIPVRATGLVFAVDLPSPAPGYLAEHRSRLKAFALERGVYLRPLGHVAYVLPALSSTAEELRRAVEVVADYVVEERASA